MKYTIFKRKWLDWAIYCCALCFLLANSRYAVPQPPVASNTATSRPTTKKVSLNKPSRYKQQKYPASSLGFVRTQTLYSSHVPTFSAILVRAFSLYRKKSKQKNKLISRLNDARFDASGLGLTINKDFLVTVDDNLQQLSYFTIPLPVSSKVAFSPDP